MISIHIHVSGEGNNNSNNYDSNDSHTAHQGKYFEIDDRFLLRPITREREKKKWRNATEETTDLYRNQ